MMGEMHYEKYLFSRAQILIYRAGLDKSEFEGLGFRGWIKS